MKNQPITLTFPESFIRDLHRYVPKRKVSHFFYEIAQKEIEAKKKEWILAYQEASMDEELREEAELWDVCIGDGIDETNEYIQG